MEAQQGGSIVAAIGDAHDRSMDFFDALVEVRFLAVATCTGN